MKKYLLFLGMSLLLLFSAGLTQAQTLSAARVDYGLGCDWPFSAPAEAPNGDIYVMWRDGGSTGTMKLIKWNGSGWTSIGSFTPSNMSASINFNVFSDYVSMDIDASGNYHVVFGASKTGSCCSQPRGFAYAYSTNGTSWTFEQIVSYTDPSGWKNIYDPMIKVDDTGVPHVSGQFTNSNNSVSFMGSTYNRLYTVKYFKRTGAATWSDQTPFFQGGASNEVGNVSLALDKNNRPHFAFTAETNGSGLDPSLCYVYMKSGGTFSTMVKVIAGSGSSSPFMYNYEGFGNDIEIEPGQDTAYIISTNYQGRLKMTTIDFSGPSISHSTAVVNTSASSTRDGFNITSGGHKFAWVHTGSGFQSAVQESGSSTWTYSTNTISPGGGGYFPSGIMNDTGAIIGLYDRPPAGSCGASNHRELWAASGSYSLPSACSNTTASISPSACVTYTSPSGKVWTTSGTRNDTITNGCGSDSIITINLTINPLDDASFSYTGSPFCSNDADPTPTAATAGTYSSTAGLVFVSTTTGQIDVSASTPGTYTVTHNTTGTCPNSSTQSVTINATSTATINPNVCDSYTSPSGKVWTTSGTRMDTIPNDAGCDSIITVNLTIRVKTFATINPNVCDSYTSPSGKVWTTSGTRMDTIPNDAGCDSVITVNLTIRVKTFATINPNVCDSYTSPSGKVWTTSGTRNDTIPNDAGCDSVITVNLTIRVKTFATINPDVCDSYTSPSGKVWTTSGTRMDTIPNDAGCDSVITVNLTIRVKTFATINPDVCDSYTSPSGKIWTTSGTRNDTIPNDAGCDSVITVNLTVRYSTTKTENITAYETYTSPSGKTWTTSRSENDTIPNAAGCDSVITINLTIINVLKTWGTGYTTLDDLIDSANNSGNDFEIWVKEGTYIPGNGTGTPDRDTTFLITNPHTRLYGGFSGNETEFHQRNPAANPTILSGDIGVQGDKSDNAYHVITIIDKRTYTPGETRFDDNFVVDGFIIRDGNANGSGAKARFGINYYKNKGAGMIISSRFVGREMNPIVRNCIFTDNCADYGAAVWIKVEYGKSFAKFSNCTFKDNSGRYGAFYCDGTLGETSPSITNCAFDNNTASTSGAALYAYAYTGIASPTVTSCVFNNNRCNSLGGAVLNNGSLGKANGMFVNCTFHDNDAVGKGGAMVNYGISGQSNPGITNGIFDKNTLNGDDDHKWSEIRNDNGFPTVTYSSMQRGSSTYSTGSFNSLGSGTGNVYQTAAGFEDDTDPNGADDIWRTGDDGLRLSSTSGLRNIGTATATPTTDILGNQRNSGTDMGAYEYVSCGLGVKLATSATTHTASQAVNDGDWTCYCNAANELLLALDTNGSGAVITPSQVQLKIGNPSTSSYNTAGGLISNPNGGVVLERLWNVAPTTQPTSNVGVRYFYTHDEYDDIVTAMAGLTVPTTISSPSQLQFYKVTGGSAATFPNPHATGVTGIVLTNSAVASTTTWVNGTHGVVDHSAEYEVSSFSGGGGGGGAGSAPLPVEMIRFEAKASANHTAQLDWVTASELNNSHFIIERSYNAIDFEEVGIVQGNGTVNHISEYAHLDNTIDAAQNVVYYRLVQVDYDGTTSTSLIRKVSFENDLYAVASAKAYPNPTKDKVTVVFNPDLEVESHDVIVMDNIGRVVTQFTTELDNVEIDLSNQSSGVYFISLSSGESFKIIKQ